MTESDLMKRIMVRLSPYGKVFRYNVGGFYTPDGRYVPPSLPRGHSDLIFFKSPEGKACFVEVKVKPNKPTTEQLNFIEQMKKTGCLAGVAYSVEEALHICGI